MSQHIPLSELRPLRAAGRRDEPLPALLIDGFGRVHTSLRISVTDRCNFRCVYCMPEEMEFYPRGVILTYEEIVRVARIAAGLGIDNIRLTGGEPLVRRDVPHLIHALTAIPGLVDVSLTTNGTRLPDLAKELYRSGLRRINVSLDSLDPHSFEALTRRPVLDQVLRGLEAAFEAGFNPIKVNAVAIRGFTENELEDFVRLARRPHFQVRFIEFMPLDGDEGWSRSRVLTGEEILTAIARFAPLERVSPPGSSDPATLYRFLDGSGEIGIIPTVTEPFCGTCNRLRLTSDGKLRHCLFAVEETDLKTALRAGADDEELAWMFVDSVRAKWAGHLISQPEFERPARNMSRIGG